MTRLERRLKARADAADLDLRLAIQHLGRAKTAAIDARDFHAEAVLLHALNMLSYLSIQAVKEERKIVRPT